MNKKRVRRLYRLEGLQLPMRIRRRKHMCLHRGVVPVSRNAASAATTTESGARDVRRAVARKAACRSLRAPL